MTCKRPYDRDMETRALPLAKFTRHGNTLTAEASDFGPLRDGLWWLQQMYDDACDQGIAVRSETTGKVCRFVLSRTETRDGDLLAWHFAPVEFAGWVEGVTIFND